MVVPIDGTIIKQLVVLNQFQGDRMGWVRSIGHLRLRQCPELPGRLNLHAKAVEHGRGLQAVPLGARHAVNIASSAMALGQTAGICPLRRPAARSCPPFNQPPGSRE
jgi:hypothetical protein